MKSHHVITRQTTQQIYNNNNYASAISRSSSSILIDVVVRIGVLVGVLLLTWGLVSQHICHGLIIKN
jgi:hypothetical protein